MGDPQTVLLPIISQVGWQRDAVEGWSSYGLVEKHNRQIVADQFTLPCVHMSSFGIYGNGIYLLAVPGKR